MPRKKIVAGNWKMNLLPQQVSEFCRAMQQNFSAASAEKGQLEVIVFPQMPLLPQLQSGLNALGIACGAQNCSQHKAGAYTGETSAELLRSMDVEYCLVGHSERRQFYGETNANCAQKVQLLLELGMRPILCIGETAAEREAGEHIAVLEEQIKTVFSSITDPEKRAAVVLAYEPVWAIGSGTPATPEISEEAHLQLRGCLNAIATGLGEQICILYGGSVNAENCTTFTKCANIDGFLVGGASLQAPNFLKIITSYTTN